MVDESELLPDLDPELAALVSAYATATARDAAQVDAALAKVTAQVGTAGSAGAVGLSVTTKIGIVGALVGVVGVVGIVALGPSHEPAPSRTASAPVEPERAPAIDDATERDAAAVPEASHEAAIVDDDPLADTDASGMPAVARARGDRRGKSRATAPELPPQQPHESLKAELELLRQARSALREGRAQRALEIVRQHRREYPASKIAEERDATEVSALCALGRLDEAQAKAAAFARRFSRSTEELLRGCR